MASHTMNSQATTKQGRGSLAVGLRALAVVTLALALLAGCSTPVERPTTSMELPSDRDARATAGQTGQFVTEATKADLAIRGSTYYADAFRCLPRPDECRVRDLRTPWEERRYLMPDGTFCAPPGSEAPR